MVLVAAGLFFGSALVTLIIVLATGSLGTPRDRRPAASAAPAARAPAETPGAIGLSDLLLPHPQHAGGLMPEVGAGLQGGARDLREAQAAGRAPPYLLREPLSRWSAEQVQRYWVSLRDIAVDRVRQENDRRILTLLEGVP